ncbi:MAG: HAD-IA family hydrolase [Saccharospirillaceae bacterium]|nr:HAD-IA family hydrolase [Saccharospirillaceae bacterium]
MIKVISFDLDDTLCDTKYANNKGLEAFADTVKALYSNIDAKSFAFRYNEGIHRRFSQKESDYFLPIQCEKSFRLSLIDFILRSFEVTSIKTNDIEAIQSAFDTNRIKYFDFYPNVKELLVRLKQKYKIVVITNGPTFSQHIKIETINLHNYVDFVIVGGEEPHQKPHQSIFQKVMVEMNCTAEQCIHIGDSYECDIVGAYGVGIKSVWITSSNTISDAVADYKADCVLSIEGILSELALA